MENDDIWANDPDEPCEVCGDQLCGGRCESQMPQQLIFAGLGGIGALILALLIKILLT